MNINKYKQEKNEQQKIRTRRYKGILVNVNKITIDLNYLSCWGWQEIIFKLEKKIANAIL